MKSTVKLGYEQREGFCTNSFVTFQVLDYEFLVLNHQKFKRNSHPHTEMNQHLRPGYV